jgi:hypothetical protein
MRLFLPALALGLCRGRELDLDDVLSQMFGGGQQRETPFFNRHRDPTLSLFVAISGCPEEAEKHGSCFRADNTIWNKVSFLKVPDPLQPLAALRTKISHNRHHNTKIPHHFCFLYKNAPMHVDEEASEKIKKVLFEYGVSTNLTDLTFEFYFPLSLSHSPTQGGFRCLH